eukprot:14414891-Ditylum_brightwellii.AAC.1
MREPMIMKIIGQVSWQGMPHQGVPIEQIKSMPSPAMTIGLLLALLRQHKGHEESCFTPSS